MRTVDKIQELLNNEGISAAKMMRDLNFSSGLFSQWKTGKQKPSLEKLEMIADYLDVTVEYLRKDELKEKAVEKFGFCWDPVEREKYKGESRGLIESGNLPNEDIIKNAIIVFKALFSRSLESSSYSLKHVDFNTYTSMLLNQEHWKKTYSPDVYKELVKRFGKKEGIPYGTYYGKYHKLEEDDLSQTSNTKRVSLNIDEFQHIKKYRELDPHGKKIVDMVLDEEYERCISASDSSNIKYVMQAARGGAVPGMVETNEEEEKELGLSTETKSDL